jgi:uncharacterized membrane protein YhaH (DUF805 family)
MSWSQILFSFEGRVGRAIYWYWLLALCVVFGVLAGGTIMAMLAGNGDPAAAAQGGGGMLGMLVPILGLLSIWPSFAITIKRWHDVDKSGWWVLIGVIPIVGGLIALVFNGFIAGTPGPNRFGNPPA